MGEALAKVLVSVLASLIFLTVWGYILDKTTKGNRINGGVN